MPRSSSTSTQGPWNSGLSTPSLQGQTTTLSHSQRWYPPTPRDCVSANSKRSVGQTTLLPWDSCCSQASMSEATHMVTPARKPPTPMIPSTQQQPGQAQLCPQRSPEQLATQQAVSLLQIKGPNLNLYLRYHKWVSALQAGQHS